MFLPPIPIQPPPRREELPDASVVLSDEGSYEPGGPSVFMEGEDSGARFVLSAGHGHTTFHTAGTGAVRESFFALIRFLI